MKQIIAIVVVLALIGAGVYFYSSHSTSPGQEAPSGETPTEGSGAATSTPEQEATTTIGTSVEGRDIVAYNFGTGDKEVLFVGGIHGGYSWNTALVAYELTDYLTQHPEAVPAGVRVTVVPVLNPDGLFKVAGTAGPFTEADVSSSQTTLTAGRFNAHKVDLNRNFDCDWKSSGTWQSTTVSGGSEAFSEPESAAIKDYVETHQPVAVVAWYSSAGGVFASNCHNGVSDETQTLTDIYAKASGYKAYEEFDFYTITGDMMNWLAKENIPAISVLLTNHTDTEWSKNRAGIEALLNHYAE